MVDCSGARKIWQNSCNNDFWLIDDQINRLSNNVVGQPLVEFLGIYMFVVWILPRRAMSLGQDMTWRPVFSGSSLYFVTASMSPTDAYHGSRPPKWPSRCLTPARWWVGFRRRDCGNVLFDLAPGASPAAVFPRHCTNAASAITIVRGAVASDSELRPACWKQIRLSVNNRLIHIRLSIMENIRK